MDHSDILLRSWSHMLGAHARLLHRVEERLRRAEMPPLSWYDVLWELERAKEPLRVGDLAERLVIERYNMTRLLDRLEKAGLLVREPDANDRRGFVAKLTRSGREKRGEMWPVYCDAVWDAFGDALTDDEAETLTALMKKLIARSE